jgi:hypothetical protein
MTTVFLTRKQYDELVNTCFKIEKSMYIAYCDSKRKWSAEGVAVTTDNVQLLQCIDHIKHG